MSLPINHQFFFAALLLAFSLQAHAKPPLLLDDSNQVISPYASLEFAIDSDNLKSPQAVIDNQVKFSPVDEDFEALVLGLGDETIWFRIDLKNQLDKQINFVIEMAYVPINNWDIYLPSSTGETVIEMGSWRPYSNRPINVGPYAATISLAANQQETFYFRAQSEGPRVFPLAVYTGNAYYDQTTKRIGLYRLFLGVAVGLLLFSLMIGIAMRDKIYLLYSGLVLMRFMQLSIFEGSINAWADTYPILKHVNLLTTSGLYTAFALWFHSSFLQYDKDSPKLNTLFHWAAIFYFVFCTVVPFYSYNLVTMVMQVNAMFLNPLLIISALLRICQGYRPAIIYLVALSLPIIATTYINLSWTGMVTYSNSLGYVVDLAFSASLILFSFGLAARINTLNQEKATAETKAVAAQIEAKTKSEFLAQMSHEIRTPMNGVLGVSQLLGQTVLDETQKKYNQIIHSSGKLLLQVIDDVLDFSKLEAGKMDIESIPFNPRAMCEEAKAIFTAKTLEKNLRFDIKISSRVPKFVEGDPTRIKQILYNLINNAYKFTDKGSITLTMAETESPDVYTFSVTDTGVGISEKGLEKLFTAYQQANKSTARQYGGTGLGLTICKQLCELMSGNIGVNSSEKRGSTFWFTLPLPLVDLASVDQEMGEESSQAKDLPAKKSSLHVLVAEDNPVNQIVVQGMLNALGHTHVTAVNGEEALELFCNGDDVFDMILMDCEMPVLDGIGATKAIRKLEQGGEIPIVALTAHAMESQIESCRAAGMNNHLSKPLKLEELQSICALFVH